MRRAWQVLAIPTIAAALSVASAIPASAQVLPGFCIGPVYSEVPSLDENDPALNQAISRLSRAGYKAHIVAVDTLVGEGSGLTMEGWLNEYGRPCTNWGYPTGDDGFMQANDVIIIGVGAGDRSIFVSSPSALDGRVDPDDIRDDHIIPGFLETRGANLAPGLTAGVNELVNELSGRPASGEPSGRTTSNGTTTNAAGTSQSSDKGSAAGVFVIILIVAALLVILGLLAWGIIKWHRKRSDLHARKEAATMRCAEARAKAAPYVNAELSTLLRDADTVISLTHDSEDRELAGLCNQAEEAYNLMTARYGNVPESPEFTTDDSISQIHNAGNNLYQAAETFEHTLGEINAKVAAANALISSTADEQAEAGKDLVGARVALENLSGAGLKTEHIDAMANRAATLLEQASKASLEGRFNDADQLTEQADKLIDEAAEQAAELPLLADKMRDQATSLGARLEQLRSLQTETQQRFERMVSEFGEDAVDPVENYGSTADAYLDEVEETLPAIPGLVSTETQNYGEAHSLLMLCETKLSQAEALFQSVASLAANLAKAKEGYRRDYDVLHAQVDKAVAYCNQHVDDVGTDERDACSALLREASELNRTVEATEFPDWLEANASLDAIEARVKQSFSHAVEQNEQVDLARANHAKAKARASAAITELDTYVHQHRRDLSSTMEGAPQRLLDSLEEVNGSGSLDSETQLFESIKSNAEEVLSDARSAVRKAINARQARINATSYSTPSYSRPNSGFGSIGGFGSTGGSSHSRPSGGFGSFGGGGGHSRPSGSIGKW